jgi:hypothetical protein
MGPYGDPVARRIDQAHGRGTTLFAKIVGGVDRGAHGLVSSLVRPESFAVEGDDPAFILRAHTVFRYAAAFRCAAASGTKSRLVAIVGSGHGLLLGRDDRP